MEVQPLRYYPQGTVAAHVLGYLTRSEESAQDELSYYNYRLPDFRGVSGIERSFDEKLSGRAGAKSVLVNNLGYRQTETILAPVEPGHDVTLTIDADIQRVAERALASAVSIKPARGGAAVLDVNTGEIIALASAPAYDPNRFVPRISVEDWADYNNTNGRPLLHRAIYGGHHPGSTFKIFVALTALEAGVLNPDEIYHSEGRIMVGRRLIKDTAGAGDFDFKVRVAAMDFRDPWTKASLMARESLNSNSVFAAAIATPLVVGSVFESRATTGAASVKSGNFPSSYPVPV